MSNNTIKLKWDDTDNIHDLIMDKAKNAKTNDDTRIYTSCLYNILNYLDQRYNKITDTISIVFDDICKFLNNRIKYARDYSSHFICVECRDIVLEYLYNKAGVV